MQGASKRNPWARTMRRPLHLFEDSKCLNAASTIYDAITPPSGQHYRFIRAMINFSATDAKAVKVFVSNGETHMAEYLINEASVTGLQNIWTARPSWGAEQTIDVDWTFKKYDPLTLSISAASGFAYYKIWTEEI